MCLMYEVKKKIGRVFTSNFVGTGFLSYEKRIYQATVSQRLRNTDLDLLCNRHVKSGILQEKSISLKLNTCHKCCYFVQKYPTTT
jgi:hypothetical protein